MDKTKNFFIKIDEFIFHKIDLLKNDSSFQKLNEYLTALEDSEQKIIAQVVTFSALIIPFLFVLTLWWGNHKTKANIEVKNQILEQISQLNGSRDTLTTVSATYVAPSAIISREDLEQKMVSLLSTSDIGQTKVQVLNYNQLSTSNSISKVEAELRFKDFGTQDFSSFMSALVEKEKFKIMRIDLIKDKNNLLKGEVSLMHLGRSAAY
jgi:hypothetical protein